MKDGNSRIQNFIDQNTYFKPRKNNVENVWMVNPKVFSRRYDPVSGEFERTLLYWDEYSMPAKWLNVRLEGLRPEPPTPPTPPLIVGQTIGFPGQNQTPWDPISGEIVDIDGSLTTWLQQVVQRANVTPNINRLIVSAKIRPANAAIFNPNIDVRQRRDLTLGSFNAASGISSMIRGLGLQNQIGITISNTQTDPRSGIRWGTNVNQPGIMIQVQ